MSRSLIPAIPITAARASFKRTIAGNADTARGRARPAIRAGANIRTREMIEGRRPVTRAQELHRLIDELKKLRSNSRVPASRTALTEAIDVIAELAKQINREG